MQKSRTLSTDQLNSNHNKTWTQELASNTVRIVHIETGDEEIQYFKGNVPVITNEAKAVHPSTNICQEQSLTQSGDRRFALEAVEYCPLHRVLRDV